ncbi:hypothetical protein ACFRCG_02730 [Embleya sp. NPDC056575]|uniref:hypothetical protein n=1 Tax=unclassified Embleya TaxID=2699296 RepID=UPI0036772A63
MFAPADRVFLSATGYVRPQATPTKLRTVVSWMPGSVAGARWDQLATIGRP